MPLVFFLCLFFVLMINAEEPSTGKKGRGDRFHPINNLDTLDKKLSPIGKKLIEPFSEGLHGDEENFVDRPVELKTGAVSQRSEPVRTVTEWMKEDLLGPMSGHTRRQKTPFLTTLQNRLINRCISKKFDCEPEVKRQVGMLASCNLKFLGDSPNKGALKAIFEGCVAGMKRPRSCNLSPPIASHFCSDATIYKPNLSDFLSPRLNKTTVEKLKNGNVAQ